MKKIKSIIVRATLSGNGVVQFDSKDQKYAHNASEALVKTRNNNVNYAKACFRQIGTHPESGRPRISKTLKISADGIRHAIHAEEHPFHTPNVGISPAFRIPYLANLGTIQRGYMITDTEERKKSCYTVTSAIEISGAIPVLEFFCRSGAKDKNANTDEEGRVLTKTEDDDKDTTLFSRETTGNTLYTFTAAIDTSELGFFSLSSLADRRAVIDSGVEAFRKALSDNLGSEVPAPAYFTKEGCAYQIPEKGILLTDSQVKVMVLDLLQKMARVSINKSQCGYAQVDSLFIKCVVNPLCDSAIPDAKETAPEGWTLAYDATKGFVLPDDTLESFCRPYKELPSYEDAEALVQDLESQVDSGKAKKREAKAQKREAAKNKKAAAMSAAAGEEG